MYTVWPLILSKKFTLVYPWESSLNCKSQRSHISVPPLKEIGALERCSGAGRLPFSYKVTGLMKYVDTVPDAALGPTASQSAPELFRQHIRRGCWSYQLFPSRTGLPCL